jgi:hypothetical protein
MTDLIRMCCPACGAECTTTTGFCDACELAGDAPLDVLEARAELDSLPGYVEWADRLEATRPLPEEPAPSPRVRVCFGDGDRPEGDPIATWQGKLFAGLYPESVAEQRDLFPRVEGDRRPAPPAEESQGPSLFE